MSAAAIQANPPASASGGAVNPWVIAILVALASFMEVLDTTIANVALPYIAGGMGVSEDEASWVVTTYLVSNAIILTASSFLARALGRKTFFLICLGAFTFSSLLCGFAPNLNALLLCRILQGFGGGGMVPNQFWPIRFRQRSAARPLPCSASPSLLPLWSGRRSAAGCPTMSPGSGAF
jgi:DHA2 family multidrug resistance protein